MDNRDYLGSMIEAELTRLFEKYYSKINLINFYREIAFNRVCEELKQQMEANKEFDYNKAFNSIDDWNYGFIDRKNLKSFFRKHG